MKRCKTLENITRPSGFLAFPDLSMDLEELAIENSLAAILLTLTGTQASGKATTNWFSEGSWD